ncbi:MAG: adenosine kinase [Victivallales bacterium]|jgi:sugar/nucleoside kinase (ribokinase family)|nr:adenosine kinase [Victivallales bacterium]
MGILNGRNSTQGGEFRLLGVGSPLLDILVPVDEKFLGTIPGEKGGMMMVDAAFQQSVLDRLPVEPRLVPGGSAGNTVFALALLGVPTAMFGKLGNDGNGRFYREKLREFGGSDEEFLTTAEMPTGTCLSMITPDAERTMRSALAASLLVSVAEAEAVDYGKYDFVYIEGYMFYSAIMPTVLRKAKAAGCKIGLDLASFEVVRDFKTGLTDILKDYIDVIMANREEATMLFGDIPLNEQLRQLSQMCEVVAIKLGKEGAVVKHGEETVQVPAELVEHPVDTTGAGDLWATGFLYGLYREKSLSEAAFYGSLISSEVVKVVGSEIPEERWSYIKGNL